MCIVVKKDMRTWGSLVIEIRDYIYISEGYPSERNRHEFSSTFCLTVLISGFSRFSKTQEVEGDEVARALALHQCMWLESSPGVDALCRLSLLFPAVLALAPLRIYSGHSGLPIAPLRNQHFVISIRSDTDEHLKTIFGCGFHLCFDASRGRHSEWKNSFCLLYA